MKTQNQNKTVSNTRVNAKVSQSGGKRIENKDDLDSRSGEEQDDKGDDVTHNEKETKEGKNRKRH